MTIENEKVVTLHYHLTTAAGQHGLSGSGEQALSADPSDRGAENRRGRPECRPQIPL